MTWGWIELKTGQCGGKLGNVVVRIPKFNLALTSKAIGLLGHSFFTLFNGHGRLGGRAVHTWGP